MAKKIAMLKEPKKPKLPKAPKLTASNEVKERYVKRIAEIEKAYKAKKAEVRRENKKRATANKRAAALDVKIQKIRAAFCSKCK